MLSWSGKRKLMYGGGFFLIVVLILGLVFWKFFYHTPTCSDGVQNGLELGVDCGGSCQNVCTSDTLPPVVYWAKAFNISGDNYSVAAYIQNPNTDSENAEAAYEFRVFDDKNVLIGVRDGTTFIPKNKKFVVFESGFAIPNRNPKYVEFRFTSLGTWQKDASAEPKIDVSYSPLSATTTAPTFSGTLTNNSSQNIGQIELVGVVSDANGNALGVSRTFIDSLTPRGSDDFAFTWQEPFGSSTPTSISVIYRIVQ